MHKYFPYARFFYSPDDGGAAGASGADGAQGSQNSPQGGSGASGGQSTEQIVAAVLGAIEARQQRAGDAVIKSMAEQYGMTTDEVKALLKAEQDKKAGQLPPEAQAAIDKANAQLKQYRLASEVSKIGAAMGLVDADVALQLMDQGKISFKDDGAIDGVQSALDALKEKKPYLFKAQEQKPGAWGQSRQGGAPEKKPGSLRDALTEYYKK